MSQPSEQRIKEELEDAKEMWGPAHEAKRKLQAMYRKKYTVPHIKLDNVFIAPLEYRSGRYSDAIDRTKGLLRVNVRYGIDAKTLAPRGREHAETTERWLNDLPSQIKDARLADEGVTFDVSNYGYAFKVILPDAQKWADYPEYELGSSVENYNKAVRRYGELAEPPIAIYHIPVLTAYPLISGSTIDTMYQSQTVRAYTLMRQFPDFKPPKAGKKTDEYEFVTVIDDEYVSYLVTQKSGGGAFEFVKAPWPHRMPLPKGTAPVVLYDGLTTGDLELEFRWKGYFEDFTDPVIAQDMIVSQQATLAAVTATPTFVLRALPSANVTPEQIEDWSRSHEFIIGGPNFTPPGCEWVEMKFNTQNPVQEYVYSKLEAVLDSRDPPALKGQLPAGTTGYALNLATEAAYVPRKPIAENMAAGDVEGGRLLMLCLGALARMAGGEGEPVDVPVFVRSRNDEGIEAIYRTWSDVKDYGGLLRATREAELQTDELANLDAVAKAISVGLPTADSLERYGKRENPQELLEERAAEDMLKEEPFATQERERIARQLGLIRDGEEGVMPEQAAAMGEWDPAMQQILASGGASAEGGMAGGGMPPPGVVPPPQGGRAGMVSPPQSPPQTGGPAAIPAATGVSVKRANPRAGQKSRPSGPRRKASSVQMKASA